MYFSDVATFQRLRVVAPLPGTEPALDSLRQPETTAQPDLTVWCRAWPNREGRREGVEAMTSTTHVTQIAGVSVAVPHGTDVAEGDRLASLTVLGEAWLGGNTMEVRAIEEHRRYREVFCEVVR